MSVFYIPFNKEQTNDQIQHKKQWMITHKMQEELYESETN